MWPSLRLVFTPRCVQFINKPVTQYDCQRPRHTLGDTYVSCCCCCWWWWWTLHDTLAQPSGSRSRYQALRPSDGLIQWPQICTAFKVTSKLTDYYFFALGFQANSQRNILVVKACSVFTVNLTHSSKGPKSTIKPKSLLYPLSALTGITPFSFVLSRLQAPFSYFHLDFVLRRGQFDLHAWLMPVPCSRVALRYVVAQKRCRLSTENKHCPQVLNTASSGRNLRRRTRTGPSFHICQRGYSTSSIAYRVVRRADASRVCLIMTLSSSSSSFCGQ